MGETGEGCALQRHRGMVRTPAALQQRMRKFPPQPPPAAAPEENSLDGKCSPEQQFIWHGPVPFSLGPQEPRDCRLGAAQGHSWVPSQLLQQLSGHSYFIRSGSRGSRMTPADARVDLDEWQKGVSKTQVHGCIWALLGGGTHKKWGAVAGKRALGIAI